MRLSWALLAVLLAALFGGCAQVLGVDDVEIGAPAPGGGTASAGMGGAGGEITLVGGGAAETCTNGVDDNDDGLIDCEDPICGNHTCVPEAPSLWSGPYAVHIAATTELCPEPTVEILAAGEGTLDAPPATCTTCMCVVPPTVCDIPRITHFSNDVCGMGILGAYTATQPGVCEINPDFGSPDSVRGASHEPASGLCVESGGDPTVTPPTFPNEARVCEAAVGGGCDAGMVCGPYLGAPFSDRPCIVTAGDTQCPDRGPYTERTVVYTGVDDQRTCTGCSCGGLSGATCTGTSEVWEALDCTGPGFIVPHDDSCTGTNTETRSTIYTPNPPGGSCPANGGLASGAATPLDPRTLCCLP